VSAEDAKRAAQAEAQTEVKLAVAIKDAEDTGHELTAAREIAEGKEAVAERHLEESHGIMAAAQVCMVDVRLLD